MEPTIMEAKEAVLTEGSVTTVLDALKETRQRQKTLTGQLNLNQGLPTFTGRMTLEEFIELTVVHNRRWADDAGASVDDVTQRDIIDTHANGLATFILQGLVQATHDRLSKDGDVGIRQRLTTIQNRVGLGAHYGLPPVTLVLKEQAQVRNITKDGEPIVTQLTLPTGMLFAVADGQHRREAARRVRDMLIEVISNRRIPKSAKFYPQNDNPVTAEEIEAWVAIQDTFRSWTSISYEAHIGLSVPQARQMFTNYNCHVKPVKAEFNLSFDQSNPINTFAKEWLAEHLKAADNGGEPLEFDLRQLASINGFLFLGKTTIRSAPYNVEAMMPSAREFWTTLLGTPEWRRKNALLHEVPVIKGLAKAWFYVFLARRHQKRNHAEKLRAYIRQTRFDREWVDRVEGLSAHIVPADNNLGFRFSPAHNDIVAKIVANALGS